MTDLTVRPAQQHRSRETWARVLDAGVEVLAERGGDGFTIAAVCERAGVTPPTVYRRAPSKDALFLAVYEHGIARIQETESAFAADAPRAADASAAEVIGAAVATVVRVFLAHRGFLRAVIVISATNPVVRDRGIATSLALRDLFLSLTDEVTPGDRRALRASLFQTVFGALVLRTGFGPDFASEPALSDEEFVADLQQLATRVLL